MELKLEKAYSPLNSVTLWHVADGSGHNIPILLDTKSKKCNLLALITVVSTDPLVNKVQAVIIFRHLKSNALQEAINSRVVRRRVLGAVLNRNNLYS